VKIGFANPEPKPNMYRPPVRVVRLRGQDRGVHRMIEVDELDSGAHAYLPGETGQLAHQQLRNWQRIDPVGVEWLAMMLADPASWKPSSSARTISCTSSAYVSAALVCGRNPFENRPNRIPISNLN
jgi:hypothetical protein